MTWSLHAGGHSVCSRKGLYVFQEIKDNVIIGDSILYK